MAGFGSRAFSGATSGIGQALGSLFSGDQAQQAGFDSQAALQSKMALALAQVQQAQAAAEHARAQTAETAAKADVLARRPGIADEVMAASSGVDVPTLNAWRTRQRTGQAPQVAMGPPDEAGDMGQGSAQFGAATSSRIGQQLARLLPILSGGGDLNPDSYAKALNEYRGADLGDQVLAGQRTAGDVGRAQAAIAGKPLTAAHEFGVADLFGTGVDVSNPAAQRFSDYRVATTGAQRANAAQSYAAADHSRAGSDKLRLEATQQRDAPKGVLVQTDSGPVFADPRTGSALPVMVNGKPVTAAPKPLPEAAQKQIVGTRNLQDAVANYREKLAGFSLTGMLEPDARAMMGNAYNNMMLQAKEAYNLGVLNGPDYEILQSVVKDPTKPGSALVGKGALDAQAAELSRIAAGIEKTALEAHGKAYTPRAPVADRPTTKSAPGATSPFSDAEKERRYQVWKAQQKAPA